MSEKGPIAPGQRFAVPLRSGGACRGIVARSGKRGVLLGYFFGPAMENLAALGSLPVPAAVDAVLVRRFGDLGLRNGSWALLGAPATSWNPKEWPVPVFGRINSSRTRAWQVKYADPNVERQIAETPCIVGDAEKLPRDLLSGYGAVEIALTGLLTKFAEVSASSHSLRGQLGKQFYLYFSSHSAAMDAANELSRHPYKSSVRPASHDTNWLLLATALETRPGDPLPSEEALMERIATAYRGDYDGWENDV